MNNANVHMADWNPEQYLKFNQQRTQPAIDLAKRLSIRDPETILDVGCGPGNSTNVLKAFFPKARILGIDNSPDMIKTARSACPGVSFMLCDAAAELDKLPGGYDVIFSNACLQWIPDHRRLIPALFNKLNENGVLAVQVPMNGEEPLYKIADAITAAPKWNLAAVSAQTNRAPAPKEYFDILGSLTVDFELWETVYYHAMPTCRAMVEWIKGTRLRPYLNALDGAAAKALEEEIIEAVQGAYKPQANGEFLLKFRRFFFTATKA